MSGRRPIGAVDSIWLAMDRPANLMVIDSVMWFDEPVDWERLTAVVRRRLVDRYPVFRQRPVEASTPLGMPHWEDDPDFSLDRHLRRVALRGPGDDGCLQDYVEQQMSQPLDRRHPLWELHFVDGYLGGSVVISRFHHSLADGIALTHVLLSLTDADPTADLEELEAPRGTAAPAGRGWLSGPAAWVSDTAAAGLREARQLISALPDAANPLLALDVLKLGLQTGQIADKLFLGTNPDTPLSGTPGVPKRAVWSRPRFISDVKRISHLAGATVNDVLVAAVSGALTAYLVDHGGDPVDLTTMVPVNLRPLDRPLPPFLGNKFALVMLPLPTGVRAPLQRLSETKRRMDSIKSSPEAVLTFGIVNAIGRTTPELARVAIDFFAGKTIGVTTNVPGPLVGRYVAGSRIAGVLGWVPGSGRQTVGICIFSYDRTVRVGFKVDAGVVPDPEKLVHAFDEEMDVLLRMAQAA
ncbi:MAG TPA: wax ester/triacylglycerol synthase family O-acyltransferase [Actinomycetes bacterium]|nr:wax ester/triacylglycerol synthase family O-acyltransferase [Actinomycetes bacterium]